MAISVKIGELELAWKRFKRDLQDRCFIVHPHLVEWIETDLTAWLGEVAAQIETGYAPRPSRFCAVPKARHLIRPASILEPEDAVVYNFTVGRTFPRIVSHLKSWPEPPDAAYLLASSDDVEWTQMGFLIWQSWRERSVAHLKPSDIEYVVVTDITGFYENIDLQKLASDLRAIGADSEIVDLLQRCLRNWALPRNEGIPQGYSASDILAKLYLDSVDRYLRNDGFAHIRYVDDVRVFCRSKLDGKRVIRRLSAFLYPKGLNLQSAKTEILDKQQARRRFDGVTETIDTLNRKLADELAESSGGYIRPIEVLMTLAARKSPAPEVLERAFAEHFGVESGDRFDSTLFHYLLVRLSKVRSRVAVGYSIDVLQAKPEETESVLGYLADVGIEDPECDQIVAYLASTDAIYDYQLYQVVRWFAEHGHSMTYVASG